MSERNGSGGNLIVAVIIAIIVGVVVYFLIDSRPAGEVTTPTDSTGSIVGTGVVAPPTTTGG